MSEKADIRNEAELARAIAAAFERLPSPDPRRLAAIEARLADVRGERAGLRWLRYAGLAAALAAGAAAAWWAMERSIFAETPGEKQTAPATAPGTSAPLATDETPGATPERDRPASPTRRPPVIYQREGR
jgi:hypothetical protein